MRNRKPRRKNIVFNIMICIIVIVHCRRSRECVCTNISLPGIQVSAADGRHVPHAPQVLYIIIIYLYNTRRVYLVSKYNYCYAHLPSVIYAFIIVRGDELSAYDHLCAVKFVDVNSTL